MEIKFELEAFVRPIGTNFIAFSLRVGTFYSAYRNKAKFSKFSFFEG